MSAYQVNKRHNFLMWLITVKDEEQTSYDNMQACVTNITVCICVFSVMEVISYFIYLLKVEGQIYCMITQFNFFSSIPG